MGSCTHTNSHGIPLYTHQLHASAPKYGKYVSGHFLFQTSIPIPAPVAGILGDFLVPEGGKVTAGIDLCKIKIAGVWCKMVEIAGILFDTPLFLFRSTCPAAIQTSSCRLSSTSSPFQAGTYTISHTKGSTSSPCPPRAAISLSLSPSSSSSVF